MWDLMFLGCECDFWDMMPCRLVDRCLHFRQICTSILTIKHTNVADGWRNLTNLLFLIIVLILYATNICTIFCVMTCFYCYSQLNIQWELIRYLVRFLIRASTHSQFQESSWVGFYHLAVFSYSCFSFWTHCGKVVHVTIFIMAITFLFLAVIVYYTEAREGVSGIDSPHFSFKLLCFCLQHTLL